MPAGHEPKGMHARTILLLMPTDVNIFCVFQRQSMP